MYNCAPPASRARVSWKPPPPPWRSSARMASVVARFGCRHPCRSTRITSLRRHGPRHLCSTMPLLNPLCHRRHLRAVLVPFSRSRVRCLQRRPRIVPHEEWSRGGREIVVVPLCAPPLVAPVIVSSPLLLFFLPLLLRLRLLGLCHHPQGSWG
jgi:hypothetical protein